jgi:hypothetical protein
MSDKNNDDSEIIRNFDFIMSLDVVENPEEWDILNSDHLSADLEASQDHSTTPDTEAEADTDNQGGL